MFPLSKRLLVMPKSRSMSLSKPHPKTWPKRSQLAEKGLKRSFVPPGVADNIGPGGELFSHTCKAHLDPSVMSTSRSRASWGPESPSVTGSGGNFSAIGLEGRMR